jgi:hypothetical protein
MSLPDLSNAQINRMFKGCPEYSGCCSKDHIPKDLNGKFAIVNLQDQKAGNGTHWVLLYDVAPKSVSYFDSFGEVPPESVQAVVKASGKRLSWNNDQLQAYHSESCGWWCVRAANALLNGKSIKQFAHSYNLHDTSANEATLRSQFNK